MAIAKVHGVAFHALNDCVLQLTVGRKTQGLAIEPALFLGLFLALLTSDCAETMALPYIRAQIKIDTKCTRTCKLFVPELVWPVW
jgi:hypothetical protein